MKIVLLRKPCMC